METAVVTGAGRGIGREIARRLVGKGYSVLVTDIDEASAQETATELGERCWAMGQDVRDPDSHRAVAAAAAERGPLKVWVNNAGIMRAQKGWRHSDDEVRSMVEVNVLGVMWGSNAAIDAIGEAGGEIINMASMSALTTVPGIAVYAATKHAVHGFTISLAGDLQQAGLPIRVHAICPDAAATEMVAERRDDPDAAMVFSGSRLLSANEVADKAVSVLGSDRIVVTIPRGRAFQARLTAPFPRFAMKILPLIWRMGERRRQRANT